MRKSKHISTANAPFHTPDWPTSNVVIRPISWLKPYPNNARTHPPAQVTMLAELLKKHGPDQPIVTDEDGVILKGHGRRLAAIAAGFEEFPVVVRTGMTDAEKTAMRLDDNQVTLLGGWDNELIRAEIGSLKLVGYDIGLLGFQESQLRGWGVIQQPPVDADAVPEIPKSSVIRRNDLWVCGEHRILCGDASSIDDVIRLMDGQKAVLFSTDPPYAVGYEGGTHPAADGQRRASRDKNWSKVYQEASSEDDGEEFYSAFVKVALENAIIENAAWYCWHSSIRAPMVERVWNKFGAFAHQQIIWVKSRGVLTHSTYLWKHEPCLMGWVRGKKPKTKTHGNTVFNTTVWEVPNSEIESDEHPTSKPTKLFTVPMEVHTAPGDICYEPFSGSGSQIIAAQIMQRKCFAMEISPVFVEVAIRRWEKFSGKLATMEGHTLPQIEKIRSEGKTKNGNVATNSRVPRVRGVVRGKNSVSGSNADNQPSRRGV